MRRHKLIRRTETKIVVSDLTKLILSNIAPLPADKQGQEDHSFYSYAPDVGSGLNFLSLQVLQERNKNNVLCAVACCGVPFKQCFA
jgi:hypothetical protein